MNTEKNYFEIVWNLLKKERAYYSSVVILSIFLSLISLAIPVSVQSLVNTVTFGVLLQPIIVLSFLLLFILGINVFLNALLLKTLEFFQQHFFAKMSLSVVEKILGSNIKKLNQINQNNLSHRYYDIMTVQKSMTTILSDGVFITLQLFVGMILISLYHPYFLIFDLILIVSLVLIWKLLGKAAIKTAISESYAKYDMGNWINEISRIHTLFRRHSKLALSKAESLTFKYLKARNNHFRYLFAQVMGLFILYAFLSAFVLGVGGYLVVIGQLSMGQLVAAEIIVTLILTSLTKFGKILEKLYDLTAALDKLNIFNELDEYEKSIIISNRIEMNELQVQNSSGEIYTFNVKLEPHHRYLLKSEDQSKLNTLIGLLKGYRQIVKGHFHIKCVADTDHTDYLMIRNFFLLERPEIIRGTIEENLILQEDVDIQFMNDLLEKIELEQSITLLDNGLQTVLSSDGSPLSYKSILKLEIIRAILFRPLFIVLTPTFKVFSRRERDMIVDLLKTNNIGIISICPVSACETFEVISLDDNTKVESKDDK